MIKKILVALDASPRAPNVLFSVAELARKFDADIYPLRAIFVPPEFPPSAHVEHGDDLPAKMVADAEAERGRQKTEDGGEARHGDRRETYPSGVDDGIDW